MTVMTTAIPDNVQKLKDLLPVLLSKEQQGLIRPASHSKALSLIQWCEMGRVLTDKQKLLVGLLLNRALRRHRDAKVSVTVAAEKVDVDGIVHKVLEKFGASNGGLDVRALEENVTARVLEAMEQRAPRRVEVIVTKPDGKQKKVKGSAHCRFADLLRAGVTRLKSGYAPGIFLQGEASSGKTTGARMLAETLELDWYFNGAISFPHEMLGFIDGNGRYHRTPFRDAYEKGGVYTFDEVDRSDPNALLGVNPHLAGDVATFPDKQIRRHPDCIIVATANTWGLGADANYSGATKLDAAFLSRFPIRLNWDIDPVLEEKIVDNVNWLARVRRARERARAVGLKVMFDVRIAQAGAALIAGGCTPDDAAAMTYLANLKQDQRALIGEK